jgi:hypothetical protein
MAQRFAGIATLVVGNRQYNLRGNFTVSPSNIERTMIAGQDTVHGYQELPRVPYIEGDLSTTSDLTMQELVNQTNVNVIAQLANGFQYTLVGATCKANLEENTRDGQVRVRWEGLSCEEMATPGANTALTPGSSLAAG